MRITSPGWRSRALVTRAPLTNVPLVDPASSTQRPSIRLSIVAWRLETVVSAFIDQGMDHAQALAIGERHLDRIVATEVSGLAKVGPIRGHADTVQGVIRSPQTAVHFVTVLEEMPVQETLDGVAERTTSQTKR